ncbi:MAG: zinc ribbon domain-containing protein [Candidatus ainarchaeum sp.]|nr:zinc ribbon domain-containing protein [Candidatus ainarchaeum sp.]
MSEEEMPRRLARFYRKQNNSNQTNYNEGYSYTEPNQPQRHSNKNEEKNYLDQQNLGTSNKIPTMDYEDVDFEMDKKNREEIQKIREKNLVEKLALEEIAKFKVQNNRMPSQKEEEQIAENLFKQLKDNPTETQNQRTHFKRGRNSNTSKETIDSIPGEELESINPIEEDSLTNNNSVKDLFKEDAKKSSNTEKDDFDLGISDLDGEEGFDSKETTELDSIKELSLEDESTCPNCKKPTEKIIYCPKCGTAFCLNCTKTIGNEKFCPKCGVKIKI